jgi:hypothetical protein
MEHRLGEATISKTDDFYIVGENGVRTVENIYRVRENNQLPFTKNVNGLDQFIHRAQKIKSNAMDIEISGDRLSVEATNKGIQVYLGAMAHHLSSWSLNQLASAMHIPVKYVQEMMKHKKYDLLNQNFSSWISSHGNEKKFKVRTHDNMVRGILSTDYVTADVDYVLPILRKGLSDTTMSFRVDRGTINPEFTNIRIISNQQIDVGGDPHFVGFRFATSDVGQSVVKFEYFIFRSMCSNGMFFGKKGGELLNKRHTTKDMVNTDYMAHTIRTAFTGLDKLIEKTSDALIASRGKSIRDEDMERVIDRFLSRTTFGKRRTDQLFERVWKVADNDYEGRNLFSVANAITGIAQEFDIKAQEEAEAFAGDLLFMKL